VKSIPQGDKEPLLCLEAGGPTAFVTGLAFSPDGKTLYATGFDKVVRVWTLNAAGAFTLDQTTYRVPIGPGLEGGALNALALSADGTWLAMGGLGLTRGGSGFHMLGWTLPVIGGLDTEMRRDQGMIYVFNTRDGRVRVLRGHTGPVLSLTFAPVRDNLPPLLVSAAREWDERKNEHIGAVRLWDLDKAASLATSIFPDHPTKPALAVQATGGQLMQLQVAIAWEDQVLRLWDVESGKVRTAMEGPNNNTAVSFTDPARILTGSANQLRLWNLRGAQANVEQEIPFPATQAVYYFPRALALCSTTPGKTDYAAVVVRRKTRTSEEDWLYLLDLSPKNFGAVRAKVALGQGGVPILASSPRGQFLAVAGYPDHAIRLFSLPKLRNGQEASLQVLHAAGLSMRHVRFVRKGKNLGLRLSPDEQGPARATPPTPLAKGGRGGTAGQDGLVFDFANRSLTTEATGWENASPTVDDREVQEAVHKVKQTALKDMGDVTAYALLPLQPRLLAIAYRDPHRQPFLGLYDAATGEQVRQCIGHLDLIRGLSFSADGKLLASAADDQTVCIWSLTDLDRTMQKRGMLQGVAVSERGKEVVVVQLDPKSLAPQNQGKLNVGDVLQGIMDGGKLRPLTSAYDFYDALWHTKPGAPVSFRVRGQTESASLRVGQGVDERKPLFSLFLTHHPSKRGLSPSPQGDSSLFEKWEWIGWSPVGFYESSGSDAERYVGWHFNTGKPDQPTSFALADQYHKQYYRKGILQRLLEEGQLPKQEPEVPLPRPSMTLWIDEAGLNPEQVDGRILVRQPRATLNLAINNFPRDKVASLDYRLDGGTPLAFPRAGGEIRSLTLSLYRGRHDLRVILRTLEADAKTYEEPLSLLCLPPPPRVTSSLPRRQVVDKPGFRFRAEVRSAIRGQEVAVRLVHKHLEKTQHTASNPGAEIDQEFQLQPGENLIELSARNQGAALPYEELETTTQVWSVVYRKKDPPLISLTSVVILAGISKGHKLPIEPGKSVVVDSSKVRVEGQVIASEELALVHGKLEETAPRPLVLFEPHKLREFAIQEELSLAPGPQKFRVWAKTGAGGENETAVTIDYRPPLPTVVLTSPPTGTILYDGQDAREIRFVAALQQPGESKEFTAALLVNGEPLEIRPVFDSSKQQLTARVPLQFGDNRIRVQLSNRWRGTSLSEPVLVRYLRPPLHIRFLPTLAGMRPLTDYLSWPRWASLPGVPLFAEKPVADLVARLHSARPLTFVQAEVNDRRIATIERLPPTGSEETTWTLRLKDVPLAVGTNRVRLWASNADGRCREPGTQMILYCPPAPPPPPPEVEILDPRRDVTVDTSSYTLHYSARSRGRLRRLELRRDGQALHVADVAALRMDADGFVQARVATPVKLLPGANHFQVLAVNAGGQVDTAVTLSYVYKPVTLLIDQLELPGQPSRFFPPEKKENNRLLFGELPAGQLRLHGRVHWVDEGDERLGLPTHVAVWINGFKQITELRPWPGKGLDRSFVVEIQLSQPKDNRVEIQLPDLPQEQGKSHEFLVDCRQPVARKQRLHLLIVGNGEKDQDRLTHRVLSALQATSVSNDRRFKTPAFAEGYLHGVLVGEHIDSQRIWPCLEDIKTWLSLRVSGDAGNDVVIVYYQGTEADWLRLSYDNLADYFARTPGAQVLLLEVTRDATAKTTPPGGAIPQATQSPADPHVGVLCYIWVNRGQDPGADARLVTDLQAALAKVRKLKEVVSTLDGKFTWDAAKSIWVSRKYQQSLLYDRHFSDMLLDLLIGAQGTLPVGGDSQSRGSPNPR
jgi:WD40 repeat protein